MFNRIWFVVTWPGRYLRAAWETSQAIQEEFRRAQEAVEEFRNLEDTQEIKAVEPCDDG